MTLLCCRHLSLFIDSVSNEMSSLWEMGLCRGASKPFTGRFYHYWKAESEISLMSHVHGDEGPGGVMVHGKLYFI